MNDELLHQINKISFAITEVSLFLDTHPGNQDALKYYKEGLSHLKRLKHEYQQCGQMLSYDDQLGDSQQYIQGPWPWQRGDLQCGYMKRDLNIQ